jgi:hypothetical protein
MPRAKKKPRHPSTISKTDIERALLPSSIRQMGEPTRERESKDIVPFERQEISAGGWSDGIVSSRTRMPLHHPALRFEATAKALAESISNGKRLPDPVKLTPVEKQLDQNEHLALWWAMEWHCNREIGHVGTIDLNGGNSRGGGEGKLAMPEREDRQRKLLMEVIGDFPEPGKEFLEQLTSMHFPEMRHDQPRYSLHDLAFHRGFDSQDKRKMESFSIGYMKCLADFIAHKRQTILDVAERNRRLSKQDRDEERRKRSLGLK